MIRVGTGDYLLWSNDRKTLWRIYSYHEDGSASILTDRGERPLRGTFWCCSKYVGLGRPEENDQVLEWSEWEPWCTTLRSRAEAIDEAMKSDARRMASS